MNAYRIGCDLKRSVVPVERDINHRKMEENIFEVFPAIQKHRFFGFGGALTQASGYVLSQMDSPDARSVLASYYGNGGVGYGFVRVPIDSCDFSTGQYSACRTLQDFKNGAYDFSNDEAYIFKYLDIICEEAGRNVPIMFSPWSPPAYFKDNGSRIQGGRLREECYRDWALYIARYLCEYRRRGYNVWALSIQNEPHAIQTWDSCLYTAHEERKFLVEHLKGALEANGLGDVLVLFWDHNKERLVSRAESFLDEESRKAVGGIAFHGYCGDHFGNIGWYRSSNPMHRVVMSEFCMGFDDRDDYLKQLRVYGHEYINDVFYGADTMIDWNLVLDCNGGPNHVGNYCMAPFMADSRFKPHSNMAFEVIKAVSRTAGLNGRVLYHSSFRSDIDAVSFLRADGSIGIVFGAFEGVVEDDLGVSGVGKDGKAACGRVVNVRIGECIFRLSLESDALTVLEIDENEYGVCR